MQLSNKKINIFIFGKDNVGWSVDSDRKNTLKLFKKSANFKVTQNILNANIIYSVWYETLNKFYIFYPLLLLKKLKRINFFAVITNNIENTPEKINRLKKIIDVWISPNSKTYNFIKKNNLKTIQLPFLVNKNIFSKSKKTKNEIAKLLGIDSSKIKNKLLIGSFQRDSLGSNLTQPKWQKNPKLLIEILQNLPKNDVLLILAGPRRHYIVNACRKFDIPYLFIGNENLINNKKDDLMENNLPLNKINLLYNLIDVYIVTSKSEGGPKAILESALTQTLIFSTNVGLAPDILHEKLIFQENNLNDVVNNLKSLISNKDSFSNEIYYNYQKVMNELNEDAFLNKIKNSYEN